MFIFDAIRKYFSRKGQEGKKGFKKFVLAAPFWVLVIAIVLLGIGITRAVVLTHNRYDTRMDEYWSQSSGDYRHVAVYGGGYRPEGDESPVMYKDPETSIKYSDIVNIRKSLQSAVDTGKTNPNQLGLNKDGTPRNWEDCWSCDLMGTAFYEKEGYKEPLSSDCQIMAVGGNFKAFHPFQYLSGGFLPESSVDPMQVVINSALAWKFFNSYDVIGNIISIWGEDYVIVGVVEEPSSSIDKAAGANKPRVYMYFSNLAAKYASEEKGDIAITCYEAMLPEAVKGVAITDMKTALPSYSAEDPKFYVVSVTGRFFFTKVWDGTWPLGSEKLSDNFELPYWEKASLMTTEKLFADMMLIILGSILLIIGVVMVILKIRKFVDSEDENDDDEDEEDSQD